MRDDDSGTSTEVRDDKTYFIVTDLKQVRVRRFATTGLDYMIKFTDTLANLELWEYHTHLHEIFQSLLGVPVHDQVCFVLRSPQLEYPIFLPFMPREKLTSECILAEIERVITSNQDFRLDDS